MPAFRITSDEQYEKALEVLDRVGGTWHGVGFEEKYLIITPTQCGALVAAGVITPKEIKTRITWSKTEQKRAKLAARLRMDQRRQKG